MSDKIEWHEGRFHHEFWTIYKGWKVYVHQSPFGWRWSATREEGGMGGMTDDRSSAEATVFAAIDRSRY